MKNVAGRSKWDEAGLHSAALQMARRCRHIVQGCLREEEWGDADAEFCAIILDGLQKLFANSQNGSEGDCLRTASRENESRR